MVGWTDGQTDTRSLQRPYSAYNVNSVNKLKIKLNICTWWKSEVKSCGPIGLSGQLPTWLHQQTISVLTMLDAKSNINVTNAVTSRSNTAWVAGWMSPRTLYPHAELAIPVLTGIDTGQNANICNNFISKSYYHVHALNNPDKFAKYARRNCEERQNHTKKNKISTEINLTTKTWHSYHNTNRPYYTSTLLRIIRMLLYILIAGPSLIFSTRTMSVCVSSRNASPSICWQKHISRQLMSEHNH